MTSITDSRLGRGGAVRFACLLTRRTAPLRVFPARAVAGALAGATVLIVATAGPALADAQGAPLAGSASATLYQVSAGEWQTTV
jgi:hypothetical protein